MPQEVTVRSRSTVLIGVFIAASLLILAAAPAGSGVLRALWALFWIGLSAFAIVRAARMSVTANSSGLVVRNFGRQYRVPWSDVNSIEAGRSDNLSGFVTTIVIRRRNGSTLIGRAASSYSRHAVERWRDDLVSVQREHA